MILKKVSAFFILTS